MAEQRLQLRAEEQTTGALAVEERLLSEPVPDQQGALPAGVPDAEGEHALQLGRALVSQLLVKVEDRFGVRVRAEAVSLRFEAWSQRGVVVDLAVEDDPQRAVLVGHGLLAAFEVDDRQSLHADRGAIVHER